ncbi:MAG: hypothetical protein CL583_01815 [Alteromonadaceae bacterium]|nr:hypothetical protein [Alteromonadaceae bacterium]
MSFFDIENISARRAWHDTFYVRKDDVVSKFKDIMGSAEVKRNARDADTEYHSGHYQRRVYVQVGEEKRKVSHCIPLMSHKADSGSRADFFLAWDPFWRSRIAAAIRSLNKVHRSFGMVMYAPESEYQPANLEVVQAHVKDAFYDLTPAEEVIRWKSRKAARIQMLIYAAIQHHRDLVFGGGTTLGGPKAINNYLYQHFGERLPSVEDNWYRQWQPHFDVMITILDEMERKTLRPIDTELRSLRESKAA